MKIKKIKIKIKRRLVEKTNYLQKLTIYKTGLNILINNAL